MPLTFHHLIPKEVHGRFFGKALPPELSGEQPTRQFLNSYGARLCRPCHSEVHRLAPNMALALHFNTLDRLREEPSIRRWVKYAASRVSRAKQVR